MRVLARPPRSCCGRPPGGTHAGRARRASRGPASGSRKRSSRLTTVVFPAPLSPDERDAAARLEPQVTPSSTGGLVAARSARARPRARRRPGPPAAERVRSGSTTAGSRSTSSSTRSPGRRRRAPARAPRRRAAGPPRSDASASSASIAISTRSSRPSACAATDDREHAGDGRRPRRRARGRRRGRRRARRVGATRRARGRLRARARARSPLAAVDDELRRAAQQLDELGRQLGRARRPAALGRPRRSRPRRAGTATPPTRSPPASTSAAAGRNAAVTPTQTAPATSATSGGPKPAQVEVLQRVDVGDQARRAGRRADSPRARAGRQRLDPLVDARRGRARATRRARSCEASRSR